MQIGDLYYKREGLNLITIKITAVSKSMIGFINLGTGAKGNHSKVWLDTNFTPFKMYLLRGLLLDLNDKLEEISLEINEYELKCLLDKYKIK